MIIYGKQVCIYALNHHSSKIRTIYLSKRDLLPKNLFREFGSKIKLIENRWAQSMSRGGNHQGILIDIDDIEFVPFDEVKSGDFILLLDTLTDAGNIGAIIRTAYALGVDSVVVTGIGSLNLEAVARTSAGALLDMPIALRKNGADALNELKQSGFRVYGASMEGIEVENKSFAKKRVLVVGSEDKGLSKKVKSHIDEIVSITMHRPFDSLNVSVATAIILHRMSYAIK